MLGPWAVSSLGCFPFFALFEGLHAGLPVVLCTRCEEGILRILDADLRNPPWTSEVLCNLIEKEKKTAQEGDCVFVSLGMFGLLDGGW